jgi:uncharacterized protein
MPENSTQAMKPLIHRLLAASGALVAMNQPLLAEKIPDGAGEKISAAIPAEAYAKPAKPRKLLVFSKTNGFRHASIATGKIAFTEMGKKTGAFETTISEELDQFEADKLAQYDAVLFLSTTQNVFLPRPEELKTMSEADKKTAADTEARLKENLMKFIKSGHGFIGIHAATDTCYEWHEYGTMINGHFDGHPWTADVTVSVKVILERQTF